MGENLYYIFKDLKEDVLVCVRMHDLVNKELENAKENI